MAASTGCLRSIWRAALLAGFLVLVACEEPDGPVPPRTARSGRDAPDPRWQRIDGSARIAIEDGDGVDADLRAAIGEARRTADVARRRWSQADDRQRLNWAVQWEAPITSGGVEYVWVVPTTWNEHRIEGRLASTPQGELLCGRGLGEQVSFPAEELADWVFLREGDPAGPRDGGFTMKVLEKRFGAPR